MSRSWSDFRRWIAGAGPRIGIDLGRTMLSAACIVPHMGRPRIAWTTQEPAPFPLFNDSPPPGADEILAESLRKLGGAKMRAAPVHLALPDPVVSLAVFELDAVPGEQTARTELARWRFAKSMRIKGEALACATQSVGQDGDKSLLLGLAADQAWWTCIERAARRAGWAVSSASAGACFRFNRFYPLLIKEGKGGALIHIDDTAWSISIWDEAGRMRINRSRWCERDDRIDADLHSEIVDEIQRTVRAYTHGHKKEVGRLMITGPQAAATALAAAVGAHTDGECILLDEEMDLDGLASGAVNRHPGIGTAVAAALQQ